MKLKYQSEDDDYFLREASIALFYFLVGAGLMLGWIHFMEYQPPTCDFLDTCQTTSLSATSTEMPKVEGTCMTLNQDKSWTIDWNVCREIRIQGTVTFSSSTPLMLYGETTSAPKPSDCGYIGTLKNGTQNICDKINGFAHHLTGYEPPSATQTNLYEISQRLDALDGGKETVWSCPLSWIRPLDGNDIYYRIKFNGAGDPYKTVQTIGKETSEQLGYSGCDKIKP